MGGGGVVKESPKIAIHGGALNPFAESKGEGEIFVFRLKINWGFLKNNLQICS